MRTRVALALSTLLALAFLPGTPTHASPLTAADAAVANPASLGAFGTAFEEAGPNCTTTTRITMAGCRQWLSAP